MLSSSLMDMMHTMVSHYGLNNPTGCRKEIGSRAFTITKISDDLFVIYLHVVGWAV